jgi:proline dehydrogenase
MKKVLIFDGPDERKKSKQTMIEFGLVNYTWVTISVIILADHDTICCQIPTIYVKDVMPYLIRRAEENTSVAGQTSRELTLIKAERNEENKSKL